LGIRDLGLIESALNRPKNLLLYNDPDIFDLAAAYGYGLARNHGFIDGNKRTA
jgi:death-on-curing protein